MRSDTEVGWGGLRYKRRSSWSQRCLDGLKSELYVEHLRSFIATLADHVFMELNMCVVMEQLRHSIELCTFHFVPTAFGGTLSLELIPKWVPNNRHWKPSRANSRSWQNSSNNTASGAFVLAFRNWNAVHRQYERRIWQYVIEKKCVIQWPYTSLCICS